MRFMRVGRASIAAAASLTITVLAAACRFKQHLEQQHLDLVATSSPSSSKLETTHVVVGALPVVDTAGLYLALKNGYFKQAGLDVTVNPIQQSTAALPDMLHGTVDIVAGANYVSWFQAQAKGDRLAEGPGQRHRLHPDHVRRAGAALLAHHQAREPGRQDHRRQPHQQRADADGQHRCSRPRA